MFYVEEFSDPEMNGPETVPSRQKVAWSRPVMELLNRVIILGVGLCATW